MNETNRALLAKVIETNLNAALNSQRGSDEERTAFRQAMDAIDRDNNISKNDDSFQEHSEKLAAEKEKLEKIEVEKINLEKAKVEFERAKADNLKMEKEKSDAIEKEKLQLEQQRIEIEKLKIEIEKQNKANDDEFRKQEAKKVWMWRGIELGAIYVLSPLIDKAVKKSFAKLCMLWETDNTFTSTPGRAVKDFFRFKK